MYSQKIGHVSKYILDFFANSQSVDYTIMVGDAGKNSQGQNKNAKTGWKGQGTNAYYTIIDDVENKNATQLSLARTFIHESIHAYFMSSLYNSQQTNEISFTSALNELYNNYLNNGVASPEAQMLSHHEFMSQFVDGMAYSLSSFDNDSQDMAYYKNLSWIGLHETQAYSALDNKKDIEDANWAEQYGSANAKGKVCN